MDLFAFDDDYVRRLREGDRWTVEHFISYFQQLLRIKLRRRLRSVSDIEDVSQDVFSRAFQSLSDGKGPEDGHKLGAWVNGICNNILHERYRREDRLREDPLPDTGEFRSDEDLDKRLLQKELAASVQDVLEFIGGRDAAVLRAILLEERDKDEVCRELGVDRQYLRVLLHRAKDHFRSVYTGGPPLKFGPRETKGPKPTLRK